MNIDLINEVKRLSNLVNYKKYPKDQLEQIAAYNLKLKDFRSILLFDNPEEQNLAEIKFKSYIENYKLESNNDLDVLRSLIFNEVFEHRLQKELNKLAKEDKFPPEKLTKQLTDIQNQKNLLRAKLGIGNEEGKTELDVLQQLEVRFQRHIEENRHEFTLDLPLICEKCNHEAKYSYLLRRRVKDFSAIKHPWLLGRWFFNLPVLKFVKQGILTKEQAAEILSNASESIETQSAFSKEYSIDYIDYCLDHFSEITNFSGK